MAKINCPCNPMESLQLSISTRLDALLGQRAVEEGKTKAEIVWAALESYLAPQTPLERSLQTLERTVNHRFDRLEKRLQQEARSFPSPISALPAQGKTALETNAPEPNYFEEEYGDEPDEVLSEFLEFASPAIQKLEQG
ncbi:MAG: hypothetical protein ACO3EZ_13305 [Prochlorotrichaceae cyanobacterium]